MGKAAKSHSSKKQEVTHVKVYSGNGKSKMVKVADRHEVKEIAC